MFTVTIFYLQMSRSTSVDCEGKAEGLTVLNKPLLDSILMHLETIGWSRVSQVSSDFTVFSVTTRSVGGIKCTHDF